MAFTTYLFSLPALVLSTLFSPQIPFALAAPSNTLGYICETKGTNASSITLTDYDSRETDAGKKLFKLEITLMGSHKKLLLLTEVGSVGGDEGYHEYWLLSTDAELKEAGLTKHINVNDDMSGASISDYDGNGLDCNPR